MKDGLSFPLWNVRDLSDAKILPRVPRLTCYSIKEKLSLIFKATRAHARNLAKFATIYKLTMIVLKYMGATPGREGS